MQVRKHQLELDMERQTGSKEEKEYVKAVLEKEMATHSNILAWRIPGTGEPGGLPYMGLHRVRHDWSDLAARLYIVTLLI